MDLSVIIPAYNEEERLPSTLADIAGYLEHSPLSVEVIVVDDGSQDKTAESAERFAGHIKHLRIIRSTPNRGKGYVVQKGMSEAIGDYALFMDADNATPLSEIEKLWIYRKDYPVVIGSRHLKTSNVVIKQPWYRVLISRAGNILIQATLVRGISDTQAGFKLFSKEAKKEIFSKQRIHGWGFDMELLAIAQNVLKYPIKEVPISWYNSAASRLRPVRDAIRTFRELTRIKLNLLRGVYKKTR